MDLREAEEFYKSYLGQHFHMGREEAERYHAFLELNVADALLEAWDQDLLEREFEKLTTDNPKLWIAHRNILILLRHNHCDVPYYAAKLLADMAEMDITDELTLVLLIENMNGRDRYGKEGGCYLIQTKTEFAPKLEEVMEHLLHMPGINYEDNERLQRAVIRHKKLK